MKRKSIHQNESKTGLCSNGRPSVSPNNSISSNSDNNSSKLLTDCQEEVEEEENYNHFTDQSFPTNSCNSSTQSSPKHHNNSRNEFGKPKYKPKSFDINHSNQVTCGTGGTNLKLKFILGVCIIVALTWCFYPFSRPGNDVIKCKYDTLPGRYREQSTDVWRSLNVTMDKIKKGNSVQPSVYLFLHQNTSRTQELIYEIAETFSSCFRHQNEIVKIPIEEFTSRDAIEDYGVIINNHKKAITENHVILVANLNNIPAESARALHTICDTYSSFINDKVVFLNLIVTAIDGSPVQAARNVLLYLWGSKLLDNELDSLITRVIDDIIVLKS